MEGKKKNHLRKNKETRELNYLRMTLKFEKITLLHYMNQVAAHL